jgi:hypothetical protein
MRWQFLNLRYSPEGDNPPSSGGEDGTGTSGPPTTDIPLM